MRLTFDAELVGPWVCERGGGTWFKGRGTAIGKLNDQGELVAGVLYEDWNRANIICHIAGEGNWATKEFLNIIFDYPFNQLGVRRITAPNASNNLTSIKLVERMGFKLECVLEQATPGADILLYRLFREECRFIKGKYVARSS